MHWPSKNVFWAAHVLQPDTPGERQVSQDESQTNFSKKDTLKSKLSM